MQSSCSGGRVGDCSGEGVCGCDDGVVTVVERLCAAAMMVW